MSKKADRELARLLAEVRALTKAHGKKTELSKYMETTPQRITDWLSGSFRPNGGAALLLRQWVTKQKKAG